MELGIPDPVPAFNAPALSHQLQQGFWGGAQAREKQVGRLKWLAVSGARCQLRRRVASIT